MGKLEQTESTLETSGREGMVSGLLLTGGIIAWMLVLVVIVVAVVRDDEPDASPSSGLEVDSEYVSSDVEADREAVGQRPTLSAMISSPTPTVTPEPTHTPSPVPTVPDTPVPTTTLPPVTTTAGETIAPDEPTESEESADPGVEDERCAPPENWERYVVQPGDTLFAFVLGAGNTVTVDDLIAANCLGSRYLVVDQVLYLPPGAAENAPPSEPYVPPDAGPAGPRAPDCPCTITVAEGWRREQIADATTLSGTAFTGADFLAVTGPGASAPFDFVMERPAGTSMEGFLFPGTYTVQNDMTAEGLRDMMLAAFAANVSPQMRADAAAQGISFYQVLIIASLVQREVRGPETQKLVASVYYNRVRAGSRLGTTVSVQYALGGPGGWWPRVTSSGLEIDSPYNTYKYPGLPPTPIDSPGLSAITAAVYPPQTNYWYHNMACDGSGEVFSETYEEHLQTVNCP